MGKLKSKIVTFVGRRVLPEFIKERMSERRWQRKLACQRVDWQAMREKGERLVHILHVSKTGGTAITYACQGLNVSNGYHFLFHPHQMSLDEVPEEDLCVLFLRDPVSRFISSFNSRFTKGGTRYFSPWSRQEEIAFKYFSTPSSLALGLVSEDVEVRERARFAMQKIRHVSDCYTRWCISPEYMQARVSSIALIGFQESLARDFDRMMEIFGIAGFSLPTDDRIAHRSSVPKAELDETAKEAIREWYATDVKIHEWALANASVINGIDNDGGAV